MGRTLAQVKAIEKKNKNRLRKVNPSLNDKSGIYFLTRVDEGGIKYAYVGQAKHILTRLAQHMTGYQHIDLSIKKHGLYGAENAYGWKVGFLNYSEGALDEKEIYYIKRYADAGYQLRNKTSGSQGVGKRQIDDYKPHKGYRDGLEQGYKNASRDVSTLFDKHLDYKPKSDPPNHHQLKAMEKFKEFLEHYKGNEVE